MCGLTLYVSKNEEDDRKLNNTNHRGPDHTIIHKFKHLDYNISIAFHRLAIIDLKHGDQPFFYNDDLSDRQVYLVCNGEIYNYKRLIKDYKLKTKSDCHVILDLYLQHGIEYTVDKLDGEFAFIILDMSKDSLNIIYCRDRFGIRPLFYFDTPDGYYFSSELKGLPFEGKGSQVEPRNIFFIKNGQKLKIPYYQIGKNINDNINSDYLVMLGKIKKTLINSVKDRMSTERPLGCLLSGGLDSSLISGIAARILKEDGKRLNTFSIGMTDDSPDIINARLVAEHINSVHHEIIIPPEKWIDTLKSVIKQIETYDITTIRASTGQYLIAKWISENTDIKVILNGDGSDELTSGYLYFYNAPNSDISHNENIRLLNEIHKYDVLRVDRGICAFGLEARVPFLSHHFVDCYLSIDKSLRNPIKNKRMEKFLLRKAFDDDVIIPRKILYRQKDAFSDAVSNLEKSWFEYIQEYVETEVSDKEFSKVNISNFNRFPSKEAYWYYKIFKEFYPESILEVSYWQPLWTTENNGDPSARKLKSIY